MVFLKEFFQKVNFEKNLQTTKKLEKLPIMQQVKVIMVLFCPLNLFKVHMKASAGARCLTVGYPLLLPHLFLRRLYSQSSDVTSQVYGDVTWRFGKKYTIRAVLIFSAGLHLVALNCILKAIFINGLAR